MTDRRHRSWLLLGLFLVALLPASGSGSRSSESLATSLQADRSHGLVAHWTFDEQTGETAFDVSSHGLNGAIEGGAVRTDGRLGRALQLDGSDDFVRVENADALSFAEGDFTLATWIRTEEPRLRRVVAKKRTFDGDDPGYMLVPSRVGFGMHDGEHFHQIGLQVDPADGRWHHIAVVIDRDSNENTRIYLDGKDVTGPKVGDVTELGSIANDEPFTIGAASDGSGFFAGLIDQVRVYNRTLTQAEVQRLTRLPERPVAINEIAWSGTVARPEDEWIELVNNTDQPIDLTGWRLITSGSSLVIELQGTIPAGGFYLIERGDNDVVYVEEDERGLLQFVEADLLYKGAPLDDEGDTLGLISAAGNVADTANRDGGEWPAGTAALETPPNATMERIDSTLPDTDENWATNDGQTKNGIDRFGNEINGTPKRPNSAGK